MTEELSARELELLKPYLKLIDIQAKEITQLGMEVDTLRYNKRYTNTKYVKEALKKLDPVSESFTRTSKKFIAGIDPADRFHKEVKKK